MDRKAKQEIRRVLMGRTLVAEDGRLVAMEKGRMRMPMGVRDGAVGAFFLGVCKKARRLKVTCAQEKARTLAFGVMQDIGRGLYLPEQPEAIACLIRYVLTRPAVLIFDYQEGVPMLTAWTGRGITGWISLRRALKAFLKRMPKQFSLSGEASPEEQEKARKKQEKREKRKKKHKKGGATGPDEAENTMEEQSK